MNKAVDPHASDRRERNSERVLQVLIVDDHAAFRALARELLQLAGYEIVGEAADGRTALSASQRLRPGIVLLDIQLPDTDGFALAALLADRDPNPPVVILTSSRNRAAYRQRLAASPARGFIPKAELSGPALAALIG